jgi:hypothetical protein
MTVREPFLRFLPHPLEALFWSYVATEGTEKAEKAPGMRSGD